MNRLVGVSFLGCTSRIYWISPFAWTLRAFAITEFSSSRYDQLITDPATNTTERLGNIYLEQFQIYQQTDYRWAAFGYQFLFFVVFWCLAAWSIYQLNVRLSIGTVRVSAEETRAAIRLRVESNSIQSLPFERVTVAWRSLSYTIQVPHPTQPKAKVDRALLNDISGYALPGEILALMGASLSFL